MFWWGPKKSGTWRAVTSRGCCGFFNFKGRQQVTSLPSLPLEVAATAPPCIQLYRSIKSFFFLDLPRSGLEVFQAICELIYLNLLLLKYWYTFKATDPFKLLPPYSDHSTRSGWNNSQEWLGIKPPHILHIGCICLAFLQLRFSNWTRVASNSHIFSTTLGWPNLAFTFCLLSNGKYGFHWEWFFSLDKL